MPVPPNRNWGGETAFRRQVHYLIKERLEPSLKAAGSALEHCLKAQAYIRGVENFPDFMDVWAQYFRDIPCAVTPVPAKDYANSEAMIEINLIALKNGATRRKQVVEVDIPAAGDLRAMCARRRTRVPFRPHRGRTRRDRPGAREWPPSTR